MSINKIYTILLLVSTVGIPIKLVATDNPSHTIEKVLSVSEVASLIKQNLGTIENLGLKKAIERIIRFKVTVKSLEFDSKELTVSLKSNDTSLSTISAKIKEQLDSDPESIYSMKFISDRPDQQYQQFNESDMSLVIYYQDPVSKEFKRYINTPDTQNPAIETPVQLNAEQLATIQCYMTFNRLPLKKILEISTVNTLLRRRTLPTNEQDLKRILQGTCLNNRLDQEGNQQGFVCVNPTSTDDPLSYTLYNPISLVRIVRIPRALMENKNEEVNRVNIEAVTKNSAEIIKIIRPDSLVSKQLLFDKRNRLLIFGETLPGRGGHDFMQLYLLLNLGSDNEHSRVGNNDYYSSYAVMPIDCNSSFPKSYIDILAESPATSSDMP